MNMWIVLLLGIIVGWIIGVLLVRQNYEICRSQVESMKKELLDSEAILQDASQTLAGLTHEIEEQEARLQTLSHK